MGRRERVGWTLLGLVVLVAARARLVVPEAGWDAFSHWGLRAQAFAAAGQLVDAHSEHEYYPPLVPLLEAWLYLHRGMVSIDLGKTVWAVIGGAFAVCLAWHLRLSLRSAGWRRTWRWHRAGHDGAPRRLLDGQADLALTAYLTLATLAAWQWQRTRRSRLAACRSAVFGGRRGADQVRGLAARRRRGRGHRVVEALPWRWPSEHTVGAALCLVGPAPAGIAGCGSLVEAHAWRSPRTPSTSGPFQPLAIGGVLLALVGGLRRRAHRRRRPGRRAGLGASAGEPARSRRCG